MLLKKHPVSNIAALSALLFTQSIWAADTLTDALTGGKASMNLQYRYEDVRNSSIPAAGRNTNVATANTVRLRLGYETATFNGLGAMVEAESTHDLGNKKYNGGNNGNTNFASIADPEVTEINQSYLSYSGIANTNVKWGRQRIKLDNDRFIGNVGWRQNEQTFDSIMLVNKSLPSTTITAGYITNVNRVVGDGAVGDVGNARMRSPIFNVNYKGFSFAEIVGYAYLLDYRPTSPATTDARTADTYGIRLNGSAPMGGNKLLYTVEFAEQRDGSNNATNFKDTYTFLEGGVDVSNIGVFKLGYEVLGTDLSARAKTGLGAATPRSFQTPLATLHAFNGWADMFAGATPVQGLKDAYISAGTKLAGINLGAVYHDYTADKTTATLTSNKLGTEWNLVGTYAFNKNTSVGLKYADYKAKGTPTTTFATNF
ncbi:MAG TPA: alginate export family protein, partial [Gallionella sp.]|nr:alginate export family protein [Gallionella sp.]